MIYPKFLYSSLLNGITPTFSGTTVTGMPPASATDFFDWSFFRSATGNLDFTMTADTTIDAVAIYVKTTAGTNSIVLRCESSPATYTTLATFSSPSGSLALTTFNSVTVSNGRKIRFVITAATTMDIRQLMVGQIITAQTGQWATATPPTFNQGVKVTNNIGANGSVLGRSIKRLERQGKIQLEYLTDSWVRTYWEPFSAHCARRPFFYQWSPTAYPEDVAICFAEQIEAPRHTANGYLSVEMPIRMLVADSEAI